jgi:hypothetical protein
MDRLGAAAGRRRDLDPGSEERAVAVRLMAAVDEADQASQTDTVLRRLRYLVRWAQSLRSVTVETAERTNSPARRR